MASRIGYYGTVVADNLNFLLDAAKKDSYLGSGTVSRDLTGSFGSSFLFNGVTFSNDGFGGWVFDGVNDYILLPTNIYTQNDSPFSVSVWFRSTATAGGTIFAQQNNPDPSTSSAWIPAIYLGTTGLIRTEVFWTGNQANAFISTAAYNDGFWHQVCVTYGSGTQSTYIDGILAGKVTGKNQASYTSTYYYFLGGGYAADRGLGAYFFKGSISQFAFYNRLLTATEVEQNYNSGLSRNPYIYDFNARAFFAITGITNSTIISAVNTLVTEMKGAGIWIKMVAVYPFVGGSATTHKWNLKDLRDSNEAFRLSFEGGWTHGPSGSTPNGVNGTVNTNVLGGRDIIKGNAGFGMYSRTENTNNSAFGIDSNFHIHTRFSDNNTYFRICDSSGYSVNLTTSRGFFHAYSNSTNVSTAFHNGTLQSTFTGNQNIASLNLYFGGGFNVFQQDNREIAFAFVSVGLTTTEAAAFYTIVQNFQTTLGRQV